MASLRSALLNQLTRMLIRVRFSKSRSVQAYRDMYQRRDEQNPMASIPEIKVEDVGEACPTGRWFRHREVGGRPVILYLHGGAFIMRLPNFHGGFVQSLCQESGCDAFLPWYRLAPEHAFPAAPEDCLAAYEYLLAEHAPGKIVVIGDSAGGNLVLSLLHQIKARGLPMPAGAVALSPVADFAQVSTTWKLHHWRDPMFRVQRFVDPAIHYLQGAAVMDPLASPAYGDYSGFPPLLVQVGELEALRDDALAVVRKAAESGVNACLQVWQGMPHVFPIHAILPEATHARREIAQFIDRLFIGGEPIGSGVDIQFIGLRALLGGLKRYHPAL